jgi:hypothetical protein
MGVIPAFVPSPDMFQSPPSVILAKGRFVESLAEWIFEPPYGTRDLLRSKEGFCSCRPLIVDLRDDDRHLR